MQDFPILETNQVAIVIADAATGHVLDVNFSIAVNDNQCVYIICNSMEDALIKTSLIAEKRKNIEYVIYGKNKEVLKYIES